MQQWLQTSFELIQQFTGSSGDSTALVSFGIAASFWGFLFAMARTPSAKRSFPNPRLLAFGFGLALSREVMMLSVNVAEAFEWVPARQLQIIVPPLQHAMSTVALIVVAGVYMWKLTDNAGWYSFVRRAVIIVGFVYLITGAWWGGAVAGDPTQQFGSTWADVLFRGAASILLFIPLLALRRAPKSHNRQWIGGALSLLFLTQAFEIINAIFGREYEAAFTAAGIAVYLAALPMLGYAYITEQSQAITDLLATLEQRVEDRTEELEEAISELEIANGILEDRTAMDPLTGVRNRVHFEERYTIEWKRAVRTQKPLSILLVDIDHFQRINDRCGRYAGDDALIDVSATIRLAASRPADLVARYGGDEFVVLLPETTSDGAAQVAEEMRVAVEKLPATSGNDGNRVLVSVGCATIVPQLGHDSISLLSLAAAALSDAKEQGRNQVAVRDGVERLAAI